MINVVYTSRKCLVKENETQEFLISTQYNSKILAPCFKEVKIKEYAMNLQNSNILHV